MRLAIETPVASEPPVRPSMRAAQQTAANFERNIIALKENQLQVAHSLAFPQPHEWVWGRDGFLTALLEPGRWLADCSLPYRAARAVLKSMQTDARVSCFLAPTHAAQLGVALQMLGPEQAIVVICPQSDDLPFLLACGDFSVDLRAQRLWFASGPTWRAELEGLFISYPGLPTPSQFIRIGGRNAAALDALIPPAQALFRSIADRRAAEMTVLRRSWHRGPGRDSKLCLITPSVFHLWDDAGQTLKQAIDAPSGSGDVHFDSDRPISASPAALLSAAASCNAIISANVGRADLPEVAPKDMPWVTWIVAPRIPSASAAGLYDGIMLADASWHALAHQAGWSDDRIQLVAWPSPAAPRTRRDGEPFLALIVDALKLVIPDQVNEYSSQRLLWESIEHEMLKDPFAIVGGLDAYLAERTRRFQIADKGFDHRLFIERLIVPAYQQAMARILIEENLPLRLHGKGWSQIDEFAASASGPVASREELAGFVCAAAAVVFPLPVLQAHPLDSHHCVIIPPPPSRDRLLANALGALSGKVSRPGVASGPPLSRSVIRSFLNRLLKAA